MREMLPPPEATEAIPTSEAYRAMLEKVPVEFLLDADGDILEAATLANIPLSDFYRALATDRALPQVAKAIHFMTIMGTFKLFGLARDELTARLVEPPMTDEEDPRPGADFANKDLLGLLKASTDFIAAANANQNPAPKTNRYQPPTKGEILQASRTLPQPATTTQQAQSQVELAQQDLEERLKVAPPAIQRLFSRAVAAMEADELIDEEEC